jgi:hypothetical protein
MIHDCTGTALVFSHGSSMSFLLWCVDYLISYSLVSGGQLALNILLWSVIFCL